MLPPRTGHEIGISNSCPHSDYKFAYALGTGRATSCTGRRLQTHSADLAFPTPIPAPRPSHRRKVKAAQPVRGFRLYRVPHTQKAHFVTWLEYDADTITRHSNTGWSVILSFPKIKCRDSESTVRCPNAGFDQSAYADFITRIWSNEDRPPTVDAGHHVINSITTSSVVSSIGSKGRVKLLQS